MPEILADSPAPSCSLLLSRVGIQESQLLGTDLFPPRAHEGRGRFAEGGSATRRGRPCSIRNLRGRVPNLAARPLRAHALSQLLDRKPDRGGLSWPPATTQDVAARGGWSRCAIEQTPSRVDRICAIVAANTSGRHFERKAG